MPETTLVISTDCQETDPSEHNAYQAFLKINSLQAKVTPCLPHWTVILFDLLSPFPESLSVKGLWGSDVNVRF